MLKIFYPLASPKSFYEFANKYSPWCWIACLVFASYGLLGGLYLAPADYQQGDAFRIIYIHVPCAVLSLMIYVLMSVYAVIHLIWRIKLADVLAKVSAPLGAGFTFLALITGSLWGKPMWGTWWIWDARLTSELILLFLFFGIMALRSAITDPEKAARACALLTLVGLVDIPIIHYSVYWWNTLHQQASLFKLAQPSIAPVMLLPLLAMLFAFLLYYAAMVLMRARNEIMIREYQTSWIKQLLHEEK